MDSGRYSTKHQFVISTVAAKYRSYQLNLRGHRECMYPSTIKLVASLESNTEWKLRLRFWHRTSIWFPPRSYAEQWRGWVISPKKWTKFFKALEQCILTSLLAMQSLNIWELFAIAETTQPPAPQSRLRFTEQELGGLQLVDGKLEVKLLIFSIDEMPGFS